MLEGSAFPAWNFQIRKMTVEDIDAVLAVANSLKDAPHWERNAYEAAIADEHVLPDVPHDVARRIALVALDVAGAVLEGTVCGFCIGNVIQLTGEAELESIGVLSNSQNQGIGKALLEEWEHATGAAQILLEVRASNLPGLRFYAKSGFTEEGRRRNYYRGPQEDAILLRKHLTGTMNSSK